MLAEAGSQPHRCATSDPHPVPGLPDVAEFDVDESPGALEATLSTLADDIAQQWATLEA